MTHTKGPWKVSEGRFIMVVLDGVVFEQTIATMNFEGVGISGINSGLFNPETIEANANLIAAAPELLEALESYLDAQNAAQIRSAQKLSHKAIAKAQGKSHAK